MYNLISLFLGIIAWLLGIAAAAWGRFGVLSFGSFSLCCVSLISQFYEYSRRVGLHDWSGLEDTDGVTIFAAKVLLAVTLTLNLIALLRQKRR